MSNQRLSFVTPGPTDPEYEVLFGTRPDFLLNLQSIAAHIGRRADGVPVGPSANSMTFAIYGRWGTGKSTALRYIRWLIAQAADDGDAPATYSTYEAPLWERHGDPRASLALQIIRSAPEDVLAKITHILADIRGVALPSSLARDDAIFDLKSSIDFLDTLATFTSAPPVLEGWLRDSFRKSGNQADDHTDSAMHVVFVDDLDRCGSEFVVRLLSAMTYWSNAPGLDVYFVIAASREHLLHSLAESDLSLGPRTPQEALEKHVHLSVEMPDLLTTSEEVGRFMQNLVQQVAPDDSDRESSTQLIQLLDSSSRSRQPDSVFAPLLHPAHGRLTPRAVKHRFNTFMAEFRPEGQVNEQLVKRWVLKAFWPEFWWKTLWVVERDTTFGEKFHSSRSVELSSADEEVNRARQRVLQLRELGRRLAPFWGMQVEQLRPPMDHLARQYGLLLEGNEDPALAIYLAASPEWRPPGSAAEHSSPRGLEAAQEQVDENLDETLADRVLSGASTPSEGELADLAPGDQIVLLYFYASDAEERSDKPAVLENLEEVLSIARGRNGISAIYQGTIGNCALLAERVNEFSLAMKLYHVAIAIEPPQPRTIQNFATTVIAEKIDSEYSMAEGLLQRLVTESPSHLDSLRTDVLLIRYQFLLKSRPLEELRISVQKVVDELSNSPSAESFQYFSRLSWTSEARSSLVTAELLREVARTSALAVSDDGSRASILLSYANSLYQYSDDGDEAESARAMIALLRKGLVCAFESEADVADIEGKIAHLLRMRGWLTAAIRILLHVYSVTPYDSWTRRSLAMMLDAAGHGHVAPTALLGQKLPAIELSSESVPEDIFGPRGNDWWDELELDTPRSQCPSVLFEVLK